MVSDGLLQPEVTPLQEGEAVRIGTGAPIPAGADAVVQVEDTSVVTKEGGEEVEISVNKVPVKGQDIRFRLIEVEMCKISVSDFRRLGCDVSKNTVVLMRGERLKGPHIGVLAAVGKSTVTVYK